MHRGTVHSWVAEENGTLVGLVTAMTEGSQFWKVTEDRTVVEIGEFVVHPGRQLH